jgi:hypothetical protein
MRNAMFGRDGNGRRWGGKLKFTLAEGIASSGLLMVAIGVTIAVTTSAPLALVPGITYAVAVLMAYMVYRHYLSVRPHDTETVEKAKKGAQFRMDIHPLLETGWEDALTMDTAEWVDMPAATYFKVVGARGLCPKGINPGDFMEVSANGLVTPHLCPEAELILNMAAGTDSETREWCCPVYDHYLVFKKLDKVS